MEKCALFVVLRQFSLKHGNIALKDEAKQIRNHPRENFI
jgi:hypothetical protein